MQSPYETPSSTCGIEHPERKVLAYLIVAATFMLIAVLVAFPGLVLLNQELDWIPTNGRIYDVEYDGEPVPLRTAMRDSLLFGSAVGLPGILLAARGFLNFRRNSRIVQESTDSSDNLATGDANA